MKNYRVLWLLIAVAIFMLSTGSAYSFIIINGSFEDGSWVPTNPPANDLMSLSPGSTAITGWTTFSAELTWHIFPNGSNWPASDGDFFLDLTGNHDTSPYGGVRQTLTTVAGTPYHVTFDLSVDQSSPGSHGPITVRVETTGISFEDFTYDPPGSGIQWGGFSYDFVAVGPSTELSLLGISTAGGNAIGLDNVKVGDAVPEPSSLVLMALAAGGVALFRRRTRP